MGNSSSSSRAHNADDTVDFGYLAPAGVYTGPRDWNHPVVQQLICARRLAPFYRPLEDYDESWDDERVLAARKEFPDPEHPPSAADALPHVETSSSAHSKASQQYKKPGPPKDIGRPEAAIYRGAVECPICFLYYPPNINHSRCCDQAICTECFVQIKRTEPTTTHLVSEPAACPYCVQDNFGVVYKPPTWRAGIGSDGASSIFAESPKGDNAPSYPTHKRRQKSFGHDSPEVVTTDHIRPDWEAKLAAVRAAVTRRANRRIIMRQVGDRLIPVGVTSGRVHAMPADDGQAAEGADQQGGSNRRRRRQQQQNGPTFDQFFGGGMNMGGPDLEELMVMEAMRLSLLEHEQQQRKEAEEKKKKEEADASAAGQPSPEAGPSLPSEGPPIPASNVDPSNTSSHPSPSSTPPDAPAVTPLSSAPGVHSISEAAERWRSGEMSPPPFSTLRAAMTAASTAGAVLALSSSPTADETINDVIAHPEPQAASSEPRATVNEEQPSIQSLDTPSVTSAVGSGSYIALASSPATPSESDRDPLVPPVEGRLSNHEQPAA